MTTSQEAREYPPLPEPAMEDVPYELWGQNVTYPALYTAEQVYACIDADRKARQQEALDALDALRELVALKDLRDELDKTAPGNWSNKQAAQSQDYYRRKPSAWANARAALSALEAQRVCSTCGGSGVIGIPGAPCPFCKLESLAWQWEPSPAEALAEYDAAALEAPQPVGEREAFECAFKAAHPTFQWSDSNREKAFCGWQLARSLMAQPKEAMP